MPSFSDVKKLYPGWKDADILGAIAKDNDTTPEYVAGYLGYDNSRGLMSDIGKSFKQGVEQLPGAVAGIADIPFALTGLGRPITRAADWTGEATGFQPGKWAQESQQNEMSPEYQSQAANVQAYWDDPNAGVLEGIKTYAQNPRYTGMNVVQSVPSIVAGGAVGRGAAVASRAMGLGVREAAVAEGAMGPGRAVSAPWVGPVAAGIGEGSQSTGQQMAAYDPNLPNQGRNALSALAVGTGVGVIGGVSGALARRLGVEDLQVRMATGKPVDMLDDLAARPLSMPARVGIGAVQEGLFEEAPQSAIEALGQNYANDRPLTQGMARQAVEGGLAGGLIGGGFNLRTNRSRADWQRDVDAAKEAYGNPNLPDVVRQQAATFLERVAPQFSLSTTEATDLLDRAHPPQIPVVTQDEFDLPGAAPQPTPEAQAVLQQQARQAEFEQAQQQVMEQRAAEVEASQATASPRVVVGNDPQHWINTESQKARQQADTMGVTQQIEDLLAEGEPVKVVATQMAKALPGIPAGERSSFIIKVRATLGVPSRATAEGKAAFAGWQAAYQQRRQSGAQTTQTQQGQTQQPQTPPPGVAATTGAVPSSLTGQPQTPPPGVAATAGAVPSVPRDEGVLPNGVDSQIVRQGRSDGSEAQAVRGAQAQGVQAGAPPGQGAPAAQVAQAGPVAPTVQPAAATLPENPEVQAKLDSLEERINAGLTLDATRVPKAPNAPKVPGRAPLDVAGIEYVAKAINQGKHKNPTGPYARLHVALRAWDKAMNALGGAKTADKQAIHYASMLEAQHGQSGSIDAVVPLLQAMEDEFGTESMNKVMGKLKGGWSESTRERAGVNQVSPHVRLSAAWRAYRDGSLGRIADRDIRGNFVEQKLDEQLRKEGVVVDDKMADLVNKHGVVGWLAGTSWQGFGPDVHAVSRMLHHFFSERSGVVKVVFSKTPHPDDTAKHVTTGEFDDTITKDAPAGTLTVYPSGQNVVTFLHELLHAATQHHIFNAVNSPARDFLLVTLAQFAKRHDKEYAAFSKNLPPEVKARVDVAVKNVIEAYKKAGSDKDAQRTAVAEFVTYGLTSRDFQEYMKSMGVDTLRTPYELKKVPALNSKTGRETMRSNSRLGIWAKFLNGLSWILTGEAWASKATITMLDQFLSDTTHLLEEAGPVTRETGKTTAEMAAAKEAASPVVREKPAKPAKAAATPVVAAKPAVAPAPKKVEYGPLIKGDHVMFESPEGPVEGTVTRALGNDAYHVSSGPTNEVRRFTRENLTAVPKGKKLRSEAPNPATIHSPATVKAAETANIDERYKQYQEAVKKLERIKAIERNPVMAKKSARVGVDEAIKKWRVQAEARQQYYDPGEIDSTVTAMRDDPGGWADMLSEYGTDDLTWTAYYGRQDRYDFEYAKETAEESVRFRKDAYEEAKHAAEKKVEISRDLLAARFNEAIDKRIKSGDIPRKDRVFFYAVAHGETKQALQWIRDHADNKMHALTARFLLAANVTPKMEFTNEGEKTAGTYSPEGDTARIDAGLYIQQGYSTAQAIETLVHEIIHSATVNPLMKAWDIYGDPNVPMSPAMHEYVKTEEFAAASKIFRIFEYLKGDAEFQREFHYGALNPLEMVSEAFVDAKFQAFLRGYPLPEHLAEGGAKNMWMAFLFEIKHLLGIDRLPTNALEAVLKHSAALVEKRDAGGLRVATQVESNARGNFYEKYPVSDTKTGNAPGNEAPAPGSFSPQGMSSDRISAETNEKEAWTNPANGRTTRTYVIRDAEGKEIGYSILTFNPAGAVETLEDIELLSEERGHGYAQEFVKSLVGTYNEIYIHNIRPEAMARWKSYGIGATEVDNEKLTNATLTREGFAASPAASRKAEGTEGEGSGAAVQAGHILKSQAPAWPAPGQVVNLAQTQFDPRWVRKPSFMEHAFAAVGYTGMVERAGEKLTKMAEAFAKAFPGAAKWVVYIDDTFGLPKTLAREWKRVEARSHYPNLTANALATMMENMPLEQQQAVLDYLDGEKVVIDPAGQALADEFMEAFDLLVDEYMGYVSMSDDAKKTLQTKIDSAKLSDLLIYVSDPTKTKGRSMSTAPLADYLGTTRASVDDTNIIGLQSALSQRFFARMEQVQDFTTGLWVPSVVGFVSEDAAKQFLQNLPPGETLDTSTGWFHKGADSETKGFSIFTRNMGFKEATAITKAASHAAAIRNTVNQMDRVVTSARYANATIQFGASAGLVYDDRASLVADHPRMAALPITTIGDAVNASYEVKHKLRRTDQWISVPSNSRAYGAMAGKIVNGSVWAALDDIHYNKPVFNLPAYNTMIRWFKKNKTVWSPGTHMVNAGSNIAWMYLHDIPVSAVADAGRIYYKAKVSPGSMTSTERAMWTAFMKSGALIADYSSVELRKALADAQLQALGEKDSSIWGMTSAMAMYEKAKASWLGQQALKGKEWALKADEVMQGMYAAEDNVFRMAAFMSKAASLEAQNGGKLTPEQLLDAGRAAATEFLDYNIHARGVNLLKQTLIPFISWPYRALPAMAKLAVYKPWKVGAMLGAFALLDAITAAMTGGADEDRRKRKKLPAYMNQRLFGFGPYMFLEVPGLGTPDKPVYFKMGAFIPLGDLVQDDNRNGLMGQKWFPTQVTPNGPMISMLMGAIGNVDPFTGQPLSKDTDSQWTAFKKRAMFMEGQMVPPALDVKRGAERWDRIVNDKRGPLGHEYSDNIELMQLVGLRVTQVDLPEAAAGQRKAVAAIEAEYKRELSKVTKEALRYPHRDPADLAETRKGLKERMKAAVERVKNVGEE